MGIDWNLALAGAGVGFIVGLTGMGGGALMTPILVLVFGMAPLAAVSSDLVASMVMKPIGGGVHLRRGTVNLRLVTWLVIGSVPAAFLSVWVLEGVSDPVRVNEIVQYAVGTALLLASLALVAKGAFSGRARLHAGDVNSIEIHPVRTLLIGVFGGVVVGLTSVGSGSLMMVLLLMLYPTLAASELVGTDLVQAIPLVAAAAAGHMLFGKVELPVTLSLLVGAVPGVYLGARVSSRSPDRLIRPVLAVVLIVSGLKMLKVPTPVVGAVAAVLAVVAIGMIVRSARVASVEPAVVEG
ncbi:MAG: sulfite exporter TauE/SafE family protein [Acidimicrobiales bacterium]